MHFPSYGDSFQAEDIDGEYAVEICMECKQARNDICAHQIWPSHYYLKSSLTPSLHVQAQTAPCSSLLLIHQTAASTHSRTDEFSRPMHSRKTAGVDIEEGSIALSSVEGAADNDLQGARAGQFGSHAAELVARGDKKSALMTIRKGLGIHLLSPVGVVGAVSLAVGGLLNGIAHITIGFVRLLSFSCKSTGFTRLLGHVIYTRILTTTFSKLYTCIPILLACSKSAYS